MNTKESVLESLDTRIGLNNQMLKLFAEQLAAGKEPFYLMGEDAMEAEIQRHIFTGYRSDLVEYNLPLEEVERKLRLRIQRKVVNYKRHTNLFHAARDAMETAALAQVLEMITGE